MTLKLQRTLYLVLLLFLAGLATGVTISPRVLQAQTASTFLRPPYYGKELVNYVFDHEYSQYSSEINGIPITDTFPVTSTVVHCDGWRHDAGKIGPAGCYSGHGGVDYD